MTTRAEMEPRVAAWRACAPEHRAMVLRTLERDRVAAEQMAGESWRKGDGDARALTRRLQAGADAYGAAIAILEACRG